MVVVTFIDNFPILTETYQNLTTLLALAFLQNDRGQNKAVIRRFY